MICIDLNELITDKLYFVSLMLFINLILAGFAKYYYNKKRRFIERNRRINDNQDQLEAEDACIVCLTLSRDVVMIPCKHFCVCSTCINEMDKCPICRLRFEEYKVINQ
mmetsp:Transcript_31611/g.5716  ORF Transcript_31611/g.5716 Transcript_31611/m.5716 type:complete len:108 (+) Transcript_31611:583-906(+)